MKDYAQAIEEVVRGKVAANYSSYRSMYESVAAQTIAYVYEMDIGIVWADITTAKAVVENEKKQERKREHQTSNEARREVNRLRKLEEQNCQGK